MAKVAPPEEQQLKKGVLTTWDALALSIAVIAPAMAASYNTSFAATASGGSTPLSFLIAGLSSLAVAHAAIRASRRRTNHRALALGRRGSAIAGQSAGDEDFDHPKRHRSR